MTLEPGRPEERCGRVPGSALGLAGQRCTFPRGPRVAQFAWRVLPSECPERGGLRRAPAGARVLSPGARVRGWEQPACCPTVTGVSQTQVPAAQSHGESETHRRERRFNKNIDMSKDSRGTKSIFSSLVQTPISLKKCLVYSDHGKQETLRGGASGAGSGQAGPSDSKKGQDGDGKGWDGGGQDGTGQDPSSSSLPRH